MTDTSRRGKNAGFSLIELLVGVMILSIVAAPLLHAIITSANVAKKSREMQNTTIAAKNVIETVNSMKVSDILSAAKASGTLQGLSTASQLYKYDSGVYTALSAAERDAVKTGDTLYIGLKNVTSSTSEFDAMVKLDPETFPQNNNQVSIYTPMNAVFSQPSDLTAEDGTVTLQNPDTRAATELAAMAMAISATPVAADEFTHKMVRNIKINIVHNEDEQSVTATAEYSYTAPYSYTLPAVYAEDGTLISEAMQTPPVTLGPWQYEREFYRGKVVDFDSVYFFYYPNYNSTPLSDIITIYNSNNLPFTFFLIKQYTPSLTLEDLGSFENAYDAVLALKESSLSQPKPSATIYTNMKVKLKVAENEADMGLEKPVYIWYNGVYFNYGETSGKLVATDDLKRLYKVTVNLYPTGAADTDFPGTPKLIFDASKLD